MHYIMTCKGYNIQSRSNTMRDRKHLKKCHLECIDSNNPTPINQVKCLKVHEKLIVWREKTAKTCNQNFKSTVNYGYCQ